MDKKSKIIIGVIIGIIIIASFFLFKGSKCGDGVPTDNGCKYTQECANCQSETECSQYVDCNNVCASKGMAVQDTNYCGPDLQNLIDAVKTGKEGEVTTSNPQCYCCCE